MYETYVPISETIVERKPPTIADIVREKTDDGARIIDFFLDLMEGRVDDAKLCHRIDAAKQLVKYGSKEAADFIAEYGDEPCDHCESRKRGPRPRKEAVPAAGPPYAAPHLTPDFLTLLTEDFFAVLTAVDEDLMIKLVRGQTRDGDAIVEFLDDVMHNRVDGFKAHHRISAARELISHILRDEHLAAHIPVVPAANPIVVPAKAGFLPQEPSPIQRNGVGRSEPAVEPVLGVVEEPKIVHPEPVVPSTVEGPKIVRPEPVLSAVEGLVEEPALSLPKGQCSGDSAVPGPNANEADLTGVPAANPIVVPAKAEPAPYSIRGTRRSGGAGSAENRDEKPEAHSHEPDPWDGPIDSTTPGRSPPS